MAHNAVAQESSNSHEPWRGENAIHLKGKLGMEIIYLQDFVDESSIGKRYICVQACVDVNPMGWQP